MKILNTSEHVPKVYLLNFIKCTNLSLVTLKLNACSILLRNKHIKYSCITNDVYTDIVDTTFKSVVKALRKSFRGERSNINNIYAYATGIAKKQSFKQASLIMWGLT